MADEMTMGSIFVTPGRDIHLNGRDSAAYTFTEKLSLRGVTVPLGIWLLAEPYPCT